MASWLFQGNPKFYKVRSAVHYFRKSATPTTWLKHRDRIRRGDEVYFWQAGPLAGLIGWGTVQTDPSSFGLDPEEAQFVVEKALFHGPRLRVRIKIEGERYLSRIELRRNSILATWAPIAKGVSGTNFAVPAEVLAELSRLAKEQSA